ncbi:hypothetical protein SPSYN_02209 [Sporotomaculum syntrophicum]|uniref:Lipoprotein n=1 Tax=Sporotomaculum syntrophicum TaxID=182264 RepID=A0A9D3AWY6_9FIRM|nr:hypothetical protein [Sporotomaculum syntrophicum]KAF1084432.1 hypothetical protein SPSYN_02209 [Sporotomaculum syntrophicum]
MKKMFLILLIISTAVLFAACGQSNQSATNSNNNTVAKEESSTPNNQEKRISFDRSNEDDVSYKQHITDLWEKTKPLLREDIAKDYSDEQYKKLGAEINEAWVNLQIHASLNHQDEIDSITDVGYANLDGNIIGLIGELYGNGYSGTLEKREERRENLRKSRLEYKIKEFDAVLQNVN